MINKLVGYINSAVHRSRPELFVLQTIIVYYSEKTLVTLTLRF